MAGRSEKEAAYAERDRGELVTGSSPRSLSPYADLRAAEALPCARQRSSWVFFLAQKKGPLPLSRASSGCFASRRVQLSMASRPRPKSTPPRPQRRQVREGVVLSGVAQSHQWISASILHRKPPLLPALRVA